VQDARIREMHGTSKQASKQSYQQHENQCSLLLLLLLLLMLPPAA
jgi:hypothetical protein